MFQLFFTPEWFNGWDIIFDAIGLLIALLIAAYSWKIYKISGEKKFQYFSLAFLLVSLGLAMKGLTAGANYFTTVRNAADVVLLPALGENRQYSVLFYRAGFFLQMVSMLGAWLLIFFVSQKSRQRLRKLYEVSQIALFLYLIGLISVVSNFKFTVFYLTSAVLLSLIVLNYYQNYVNTGNKNTYWVMLSFLLILVGNLFFLFVFLLSSLYVVAELFMLAGFLLLLYTYYKIGVK